MENRVHIGLELSDLRKSVAFYKILFQKELTKFCTDYANFSMESLQLHLSLIENKNYKPAQSELEGNHWEFWVRQHDAETMHEDVSNKLPLQKDSICCAPASSAQ